MITLGIETSCDETSASVVHNGKLLANIVASQDDVHARFGGVVPELASRRHIDVIIEIIHSALAEANITIDDLEAIAVTKAPGLVGSLLVGISAAKGIALARNLPIIGVNHLEAHLNAHFLEHDDFPESFVALVVSGGHTSLYQVKSFGNYKLIGATRDDAAGEAFDKVAKLLELGYPGGPLIDKLATKGNTKAFSFTKPRFADETENDFSFSGFKTAALLKYQKAEKENKLDYKFKADLAASFQSAVVELLVERLINTAKKLNAAGVVISGGVAANRHLRNRAQAEAEKANLRFAVQSAKLCTDNAGMIAYVGERYLKLGKRSDLTLNAIANQEIGV